MWQAERFPTRGSKKAAAGREDKGSLLPR